MLATDLSTVKIGGKKCAAIFSRWRPPAINADGYPHYFGRCRDGFPGDPGGGMTMLSPGSGTGAGTCNPGSMPGGGDMTPSLRLSLSLSVRLETS